MALYIDEDTDQELLTPEITAPPTNSLQDLADYVEMYLRQLREDFLKVTKGTWRIVISGDHVYFQQYKANTEEWVQRLQVEGDVMTFEDGTEMTFEDGETMVHE